MNSDVQFYKEENFKVVEADGFKFEVPKEWEVVRLRDVSDIRGRMGLHGLEDEDFLNDGDYDVVRGSDFEDGKIKWEICVYVSGEWYERDPNIQLSKGDILITKDGTIGKVAFVDQLPKKATLGTGIFRIRLKTEKCHPNFVYYIFMSKYFERFIMLLKAGSTLSHLYQKDLINFKFPLPPLQEQQKIANVLLSIDEAIEAVDEAIRQAERIKKGLMQELLTKGMGHTEFKDTEIGRTPKEWEVVRLDNIAEIKGRVGWKGYKRTDFVEKFKGAISLGANNITNDNKLCLEEVTYISWDKYWESPEIHVNYGDIIMAQRGSLGKVAIIDKDIGKATINPNVVLIKNIKTSPFYLYYVLISKIVALQINGATSSTTVPLLTQKQIKSFKIPLPPLEEQQKIAEILSKWDEVIELKKAKKEKLERMKRKTMNLLLTGKIRVK